MNSLKGLGVCVLLAAVVIAMHQLADAAVILVVTITVVLASIAAYVASRLRYRRDRRTATSDRRERGEPLPVRGGENLRGQLHPHTFL